MDRNMGVLERRILGVDDIRVARVGDVTKLVGHAAVFDKLSVDLGGFRERIKRGAFKESLADEDVLAFFNHDSSMVLGRVSAGTLTVREDKVGLLMEVEPPDVTWANDMLRSIERGDIRQMSFGFDTIDDNWGHEDEELIRTLLKVRLREVSIVAMPAYPDTDVAIRSMTEFVAHSDAMRIAESRTNHAKLRLMEDDVVIV